MLGTDQGSMGGGGGGGGQVKEKKIKEAKGYKTKIKRHRDAILSIYSIDGIDGELLISGSADHTVRCKSRKSSQFHFALSSFSFLLWNFNKYAEKERLHETLKDYSKCFENINGSSFCFS